MQSLAAADAAGGCSNLNDALLPSAYPFSKPGPALLYVLIGAAALAAPSK
jgi:hypothetical protein